MTYGFSIAVGTGPATVMTRKVPFLNLSLKHAYARMTREISGGEKSGEGDVFVRPVIPKAVLLRIKAHYERKSPTTKPQRQARA